MRTRGSHDQRSALRRADLTHVYRLVPVIYFFFNPFVSSFILSLLYALNIASLCLEYFFLLNVSKPSKYVSSLNLLNVSSLNLLYLANVSSLNLLTVSSLNLRNVSSLNLL